MRACDHAWQPSTVPDYEVCGECRTLHSLAAGQPEELYRADYFTAEKNRSTLVEQVYNVNAHLENGFTKNGFILSRLDVAERGAVLEIACAPGTMLMQLRCLAAFRRVVGIEADAGLEREIRGIGCFLGELLWGLFPAVTRIEASEQFDCVVALDVFEHSPEPEAWLTECARLLRPGGQLLMMGPFVNLDDVAMPDRFYYPPEHVYLHSARNLSAMMGDAGFERVRFDRWTAGHETVSGRRR